MSWVQALYDTYECQTGEIGRIELNEKGEECPILMPICHTTANFHLELTLTVQGEVLPHSGKVLTVKKDCITIIPCTESSQSRSGKYPKNHPLFDKLQYLAGDYIKYGGEKGERFYLDYMADLKAWCQSDYAHPRVQVLYEYLKKGCLIEDLISEKLLLLQENGTIMTTWTGATEEKQGVFTVASALSHPLDALIRIEVETPLGVYQEKLWNEESVWDSFIQYYLAIQTQEDLCYVQGKIMPCATLNPNKIRSSADKGKLISANDTSGFTFRGRFVDKDQPVKIGFETTQKVHNALKWLLAKQGFHNGDLYYVAWGKQNQPLPPLQKDALEEVQWDEDFEEVEEEPPLLYSEYSLSLGKCFAGYKRNFESGDNVMILGLDSATTGRISIVHYQEIEGNRYLERLQRWYETFCWNMIYFKDKKPFRRVVTPTTYDVISTMYDNGASDKLKKASMQRILHCILNEAPIPTDFVKRATERVSKPSGLEPWEYEKYRAVACALIRKHYNDKEKKLKENKNNQEEGYTMALDETLEERDYLFGRVLAYYHHIESTATFKKEGKKRETNAMRLKYQFTRKPATTSLVLDCKIRPYARYLGTYLDTELSKVREKLRLEDMTDHKLSPIFLLGYDSQLVELKKRKEEKAENDTTKEN